MVGLVWFFIGLVCFFVILVEFLFCLFECSSDFFGDFSMDLVWLDIFREDFIGVWFFLDVFLVIVFFFFGRFLLLELVFEDFDFFV